MPDEEWWYPLEDEEEQVRWEFPDFLKFGCDLWDTVDDAGGKKPTMHILQPMPHPKSSDSNSILLHVFPCTPDPTRVAEQVDPLFYNMCDVIWNAFPLTKAIYTRFFPVTFWIFLGVLGDHFRAPFGWSKVYLEEVSTPKTSGNDPLWLLHIFQTGWFNHQLHPWNLT